MFNKNLELAKLIGMFGGFFFATSGIYHNSELQILSIMQKDIEIGLPCCGNLLQLATQSIHFDMIFFAAGLLCMVISFYLILLKVPKEDNTFNR